MRFAHTLHPSLLVAAALAGATPTGCGSAVPGPSPAPAAEPSAAEPSADATLTESDAIRDALLRVPEAVAQRYTFALSDDQSELTIDPRREDARRAARSPGGFTARDSENGGKIIALEGGPFRRAKWVRASFRDRVAAPARLDDLRAAGYDIDVARDLLVVDGERDPKPTLFAFSAAAAKPGIVGVCSEVTIVDFVAGTTSSQPVAVRKPVIYLYPEAPTRVHVRLRVDGELIAHYPAMRDAGWTITASPTGDLLDATTGRHHRYLFWEATSAGFELDDAKAHLVRGDEAASFMERACSRFALSESECGDFVTYWLPTLTQNPYSVVQFVDEARYARYARLEVTPTPDTVIRPFMVFRRSEVPVAVGAPELPQRVRQGFTVVEWGGADLDRDAPAVRQPR